MFFPLTLFLNALLCTGVSTVFQFLKCQREQLAFDSEITFAGIDKRKHLSLSCSWRHQLPQNMPSSIIIFSVVLSHVVDGFSLCPHTPFLLSLAWDREEQFRKIHHLHCLFIAGRKINGELSKSWKQIFCHTHKSDWNCNTANMLKSKRHSISVKAWDQIREEKHSGLKLS